MVKMFDIFEKTSTGIGIRVSKKIIPDVDYAVYAIYDTSTGVVGLPDYYLWRCVTTATPDTVTNHDDYVDILINNSSIYPSYSPTVTNYLQLSNRLLKLITGQELEILNNVMLRVDMVRKRLPNPGVVIDSTANVGDNGVVDYSGGFSKKFTVEEYLQFINGSLIEINITPPATKMWWTFVPNDIDMNPNPYLATNTGVPIKVSDLIVQGSIIRSLVAWGLLEVDIAFNSTDSNLSISFDRGGAVQSWMAALTNEFTRQLKIAKWDFVNSYGVALGTSPYQLLGLWGNMCGTLSQNGSLSVNTLMGYGYTASRPL